jgi:hypothetical protein
MAARASISSTFIPRRLREQLFVDPAINWAEAMQDLTDTIEAVDVMVDSTVDVKDNRFTLAVSKLEMRLAIPNPKNFACGLPLLNPAGTRPSMSDPSNSDDAWLNE